MEEAEGLCQLLIQQEIGPAPNEGSNAVDWLPRFAGFSWLAYGAHCSVVVTMAPTPSSTGEVATGGFFQQVLSTDLPSVQNQEFVTIVRWAPRGKFLGSVAAVAGNHVCLYSPKSTAEGGEDSFPEIPLKWVKIQALEHHSKVLTFSWSESGDGLLSVGLEIVMWQNREDSWICLWRTSQEQPSSLGAASWSARGIAATAEGACSTVTETQDEHVDHIVKIWWWWEDGKELQEFELSHPHQLLAIQWRPMRGYASSSQSFRSVLLTCCRDGVVRLWTEIGNLGFPESTTQAPSNLDSAGGNGAADCTSGGQFKLAFFVSAVIDVNSTLKGVLGDGIHVIWTEARGEDSRSLGSESSSPTSNGSEGAANEWLVGMGPSGSLTLWAVQSLDDLSPARGPLVQLRHQRARLLPDPFGSSSVGDVSSERQKRLEAIKVVVHMPHGSFSGPPSSLDVLEIWSPHLLRWSSIWPPVAAIGGPSSRLAARNSRNVKLQAGGKPSAWGVANEIVVIGGHRGKILQMALHPIADLNVVATLDDRGSILLWDSNDSDFSPRLDISGRLPPLWKLCGQLSIPQFSYSGLFNSLAWVPVVLSEDDTILLVGRASGVDCLLISKETSTHNGKRKSSAMSHQLLYTLDWSLSDDGHALQGVYTIPCGLGGDASAHCKSCIVVGLGGGGCQLVSWKLDAVHGKQTMRQSSSQDLTDKGKLDEASVVESSKRFAMLRSDGVHSEDLVPTDGSGEGDQGVRTGVEGQLLGETKMTITERVTSFAVSSPGFSSDVSYTVCDVVAGCADGVLRLWKLWNGRSVPKLQPWLCVGLLRFYRGPVTNVTMLNGGSKIASVGYNPDEADETVHIWGADTFAEKKGFCLEGRLRLRSSAVSLCWLDSGNGVSILGVASRTHVQLFVECTAHVSQPDGKRTPISSEGDLWTCLACSSLTGLNSLSWDAQGNLIVSCGGKIHICSNICPPKASTFDGVGTPVGGKIHDNQVYKDLLQGTAQSAARLRAACELEQANRSCSIIAVAERMSLPLLDYEPESLFIWISGGKREYARASVRHLVCHLINVSSYRQQADTGNLLDELSVVPRTPLSELLQVREQFTGEKSTSSYLLRGGIGDELERTSDLLPSSKVSFMDFATSLSSRYGEEDEHLSTKPAVVKRGGIEPFSKEEIEAMSNTVRDTVLVPGLSGDEKFQLLAIIDLLAEMDGVTQASQIDKLDVPGQRFWLRFRYLYLHSKWTHEVKPDDWMPVMESKAMAWALHSEFKDTLFNLFLPHHSSSWSAMRAAGMGYWFSDGAELRKRMENLARAQYLQKKDPKDCALLYMALDRRHVLSGLFKLSRDQRDKPLADFLLRDFKDQKHLAAALKNAYVLMGKHRYELAAAFFILGGDCKSAAVVCAKNLGDIQLALVIMSLVEGANGSIRQEIIMNYALPSARVAGDVWLASLLQWLLGRGLESMRELSGQHHKQIVPFQQKINDFSQGFKESAIFPLDADVGSYCELLASKPRLRSGSVSDEASALARIASTRSAATLKRCGFPVHALEYLKNSKYLNHDVELSFDLMGMDDSLSTITTRHDSGDVPVTDLSGTVVGSGWSSRDVVAGIRRATWWSLVLQCMSQRLQDHPHWGGQCCSAWQNPVILELLSSKSKSMSKFGSPRVKNGKGRTQQGQMDDVDLTGLLKGADEAYDGNFQVIKGKQLVDLHWLASTLTLVARNHRRFYLLHRMLQGSWRFAVSPDEDFHLASRSAMSTLAAEFLKPFGFEASRVLARVVLSCGGAVAALRPRKARDIETNGTARPVGRCVAARAGAMSVYSVEELVRFGGEVLLLTKSASHESPLFGKETGTRAMKLLSFIFFVAAAWLGRETAVLFTLLAPTVRDPLTAPEVPPEEFDAVCWFRTLESLKSSSRMTDGIPRGKRPVEPVGFNMAGTVKICSDDAWRVMGVALWTHLLMYVRKQLTGLASESAYNNFGCTSKSQSSMKPSVRGISRQQHSSLTSDGKGSTFLGFSVPSPTLSFPWLDLKTTVRENSQTRHIGIIAGDGSLSVEERSNLSDGRSVATADADDIGASILSALTSIVAGLRKQLAAHLDYSLSMIEPDSLSLWLWGKSSPVASTKSSAGGRSLSVFGASSSTSVSGVPAAGRAPIDVQSQAHLFPTATIQVEDEPFKELWKLLVVREKVCSALGLEGISGHRGKTETGNLSGWYTGRNGRALATQNIADGIGREVHGPGKRPLKGIMWNGGKVATSISNQGVILSSKREEESAQLKSHVSEDRLHLSEEFSENFSALTVKLLEWYRRASDLRSSPLAFIASHK